MGNRWEVPGFDPLKLQGEFEKYLFGDAEIALTPAKDAMIVDDGSSTRTIHELDFAIFHYLTFRWDMGSELAREIAEVLKEEWYG